MPGRPENNDIYTVLMYTINTHDTMTNNNGGQRVGCEDQIMMKVNRAVLIICKKKRKKKVLLHTDVEIELLVYMSNRV